MSIAPSKSSRSNVVGQSANLFVANIAVVGGRVVPGGSPSEANRAELVRCSGKLFVFWFTVIREGDSEVVGGIWGANVNSFEGGELRVRYFEDGVEALGVGEEYSFMPQDELMRKTLDAVDEAANKQGGEAAYARTLPRRLAASAGRSETWMPEDSAKGKGKSSAEPEAVQEFPGMGSFKVNFLDKGGGSGLSGANTGGSSQPLVTSKTTLRALAMAAPGAKAALVEKFLGKNIEVQNQLLQEYASAFMQKTGLAPDECELLVRMDEEGTVRFRFVPLERAVLPPAATGKPGVSKGWGLKSPNCEWVRTLSTDTRNVSWTGNEDCATVFPSRESCEEFRSKYIAAVVEISEATMRKHDAGQGGEVPDPEACIWGIRWFVNPGDYFWFGIADGSVAWVRDDDDRVRRYTKEEARRKQIALMLQGEVRVVGDESFEE